MDRLVVGGDVVVGPMTHEAVAVLGGLDVPVDFIHGNCEVAVLDQLAGRAPKAFWTLPKNRPLLEWIAEQHRDDRDVLGNWPLTRTLAVPGIGTVLFCHATPRNDDEVFVKTTPEEKLRPLFEDLGAAVVVCGHTHMQFDRMIGATRVVNAGSVGMPFGEPGAYWALIASDVELRRTAYDLDHAARLIRATAYPAADDFAANNVLQPPPEQQMLGAFAAIELDART